MQLMPLDGVLLFWEEAEYCIGLGDVANFSVGISCLLVYRVCVHACMHMHVRGQPGSDSLSKGIHPVFEMVSHWPGA